MLVLKLKVYVQLEIGDTFFLPSGSSKVRRVERITASSKFKNVHERERLAAQSLSCENWQLLYYHNLS